MENIVQRIGLREPKCTWDNPRESIAKRLCTIQDGKYTCWEACGRARAVWDEARPSLFEYLDDSCIQGFSSSGVIVELYMIGKNEDIASPTIWISCEDRATRKSIRKSITRLINDSGFLGNHPGVRLGDAPRCPDRSTVVQVADPNTDDPNTARTLDAPAGNCRAI
jgi:hypothetical protein